MKMKIFCIILFVSLNLSLVGKSLWKDKNLYTSGGDINIGDVIVVNVNDISRLRFSIDLNAASSSDINTNPDMTITGFLPRISSNKNINNSNSTEFSGRGQLNILVATQVSGKAKNGKFRVTGSRTYTFNGVANTIRVSGIVDPALVKGRTVDSSNIVNFRIAITGSSEGIKLKERKLKKDEKIDANLTEEDKQKILKKYLESMVKELTK
jgi:flagellar basal body L-ring protein FlgH